MRRALQLAGNGEGRVSPNPMVGAVIVHDGRIIGEGYHSFYGGPHAEVNAVNSVKPEDQSLLQESTIYVTLEPCAHHGKTPPCANLLVDKGFRRVVIGSSDPNPLVAGKGVKILKEAGIQVVEGLLKDEADALNCKFMKNHRQKMPWVILKWAQSADGFIAGFDENGNFSPVKFSSPLSSVWMHRQRAGVDGIIVGSNTERIDRPKLNVRLWGGNSPRKFVAEGNFDPQKFCKDLYAEGVSSLMVEGGAKLLESFIQNHLYDEIRVETSPMIIGKGLPAPEIPKDMVLVDTEVCRKNIIQLYRR